ncbi:hypothetical protein BD769DRAFT_1488350 [Suillus cothurnatus]|nr:hypothetical protein BD769DRAFT_1488350 [Suillus cothurnatus]
MLWRTASVGIPYALAGVLEIPWIPAFLGRLRSKLISHGRETSKQSRLVMSICFILIYILARISIIVLTLLSLRSLPPGAYDTVAWTKFITHVNL